MSEERLKKDDYVRTKQGIIGKVIKEEPFMNDTNIYLDNGKGNITLTSRDGVFKVNCKQDIIKSSPNIIDLIEVGDYVNGKKVEWIGYGMYQNTEDGLIGRGDKLYILFNKFTNDYGREKDIKSIVTHEQFENMEYKL